MGPNRASRWSLRALLAPSDRVAVEDPGYGPPHRLLASLGMRIAGVRVDTEGMVVDEIPADAKLVFVSPSHSFRLDIDVPAASDCLDPTGRRSRRCHPRGRQRLRVSVHRSANRATSTTGSDGPRDLRGHFLQDAAAHAPGRIPRRAAIRTARRDRSQVPCRRAQKSAIPTSSRLRKRSSDESAESAPIDRTRSPSAAIMTDERSRRRPLDLRSPPYVATGIRSADVALAGLRQAASSSSTKTLRGVRAPAPVQVARLGRGSRNARIGPPLVASLGAADPTSRRAQI